MPSGTKTKPKPKRFKLQTKYIREVIGGLTQSRLAIAGVRILIEDDWDVNEDSGESARMKSAQVDALTHIFDMLGRIRAEYMTHQPEERS